jgi:hypothetical protein
MPIVSYFISVGSVLIALLYVADATLPKSESPVIQTSSLYGLPKPWKPDPAQTALVAQPAPAPDMASAPVLAALPKTEPVNERTTRADVAPKKKRVAHRLPRPGDVRQNYAWTPIESRPFGGGGFFGRF